MFSIFNVQCTAPQILNTSPFRILDGSKIDAANEQTLRTELKEVQQVTEAVDEMKAKMDDLNKKSNYLLDKYRADEGHNLSHATSKLNTLWTKFNDK